MSETYEFPLKMILIIWTIDIEEQLYNYWMYNYYGNRKMLSNRPYS